MSTEKPSSEQSFQQLAQRYEYVLGALSDIGDELCRVTGFDIQLKSLLHLLMGTLGVGKGGILLYNSSGSQIKLQCAWKLSKKEASFPIDHLQVEALEKINQPVSFQNLDSPFLQSLSKEFPNDDLSFISVLKVREKLIGLLVVGQKLNKSSFEEKEISFLMTLSRNISVAINNFFLLSELRESNRKLDDKIQEVSALYQATQMIASEIQLQNLLDIAINATSEISEVTRGSIWLFDEELERFFLKSHRGDDEKFPEDVFLKDSVVLQNVLNSKEPFIQKPSQVPDNEKDRLEYKLFGESFILVPILNQGEFLGIMHLCEKMRHQEFSERDKRLIKVFAIQLGAAVKNAKLYEQAITDSMTHLYLHRYFKQRLFDEMKRAARFNRHVALIMLDIDHFKRFNDTYGHQVGDEVLKKVASTMRKSLRIHDLPARYGGEEFALVLPETDLPGAAAVAERIRRAIETDYIEHEGKIIKITASFGVSVFPEASSDVETIIKTADDALYSSKENGRNQISCAPIIFPAN
ncbi:sensor domain-containing diguanylate cyclase [bacterium]|nr:sensor domain-containing diguanylate cyclase [bacterium]